MKKYVGSGYYYVNCLGLFCLNNSEEKQKKCLNHGDCVKDKETLKKLFTNELKKDLQSERINTFICISHYSFIDLIKHSGFEVKFEKRLPKTVNANTLFGSWKCSECSSCVNKEDCYVSTGKLPNFERQMYIVLFSRKKEM